MEDRIKVSYEQIEKANKEINKNPNIIFILF